MSLFVEARAQQQIRLRGGGAEEAEPETPGSTASGPASGPASASAKKQKQMGLQYFFSSPEEKKAAKPVRSLALSPYKRRRLSRWQQDALAERDEALRQLAEAEAKQAASEEELAAAAAKLRKKGGRPQKQEEQPQRASNRKSAGSKALRLELSAKKKAQYCKEMQESLSEFASKADFWKAQVAKYGMSKQSLKDMLSKAEAWEGLAKRPLAAARKREPLKRVRHAGGGRKVPYPELMSQLKTWLSLERACGHTIGKADLLHEFLAKLQHSATCLRQESRKPDLSLLQKGELLREAEDREARKSKLLRSKLYQQSFKEKLVRWIGAKYMTSELVTTISELEAKTRCMLTWQEFDRSLWLATCASEQSLEEAQRVVDAKEFCACRKSLVIGFSDQVPLWAKATGRRAVFAEDEVAHMALRDDFSSVRAAVQAVMDQSEGEGSMLVTPLKSPGTEGPQRKLSFDSPGPRRKLSFESGTETPTPGRRAAEAAPGRGETRVVEAEEGGAEAPAAEAKDPEQGGGGASAAAAGPVTAGGSTTLIGVSGDERYRITYEARQVLHKVYSDPSVEVVGAVLKGLLVVPGQWGRLSNISDAGTWIHDETFVIGAKTFSRKAGTSVGRVLEPYRRLRAKHPEMFSKIEIMAQPAATVDSVILSWTIAEQAQQFPCSLWMRDCFSSVFSESATQSMALANQLSCLVAEKCTSRLQITDTDFSKQFKALVRAKLSELRTAWHQAMRSGAEPESLWRVGPYEIVASVVHAQEAMAAKNAEDAWVLRSAVRNGILAYRPNPASQKLEPLLDQDWARAMGLGFGTKRYPADWLSQRLRWRDAEGVPLIADWGLSESAKEISDLQVWDYYNPDPSEAQDADAQEAEDVDAQDDLGGAIEDSLKLELQNSLSLRIAPALRRAQWRRLGTEAWKSASAQQRKQKTDMRHQRTHLRRDARKKLVAALQAKKLSRKEGLADLAPEAQQKPGQEKKKVLKLSKFAKKHKKGSGAEEKKRHSKNTAKAVADKEVAKAPLPAPAQPPAGSSPQAQPAAPSFAQRLLGQDIVVISELAGPLRYALAGNVTGVSPDGLRITVFTAAGTHSVCPTWVTLKFTRASPKPLAWPKLTQLSRKDMSQLLSNLTCNPQDQSGTDPAKWSLQDVILCPPKINELEDQHIWLGWCLLRYLSLKNGGDQLEKLGVHCIDPALTYVLEKKQDDPQVHGSLRKHLASFAEDPQLRLLFVPVHAHFHWTLLVARRDSDEATLSWSRFDTLSQEHEESHAAQVLLGSMVDPQFTLPPLSNVARQPVGSNACGGFILHYMELHLRELRGEWPHCWPELGWKQWKERLHQFSSKLLKEQRKLLEEGQAQWAKEESERNQIRERKEKAEKALQKLTNVTSMAYLAAQESLAKNSAKFTWRNLSESSKERVKALRLAIGVCAKCRWQSGCLACSPEKCLRYLLHKEAAQQHKLPFLTTGPVVLSVP